MKLSADAARHVTRQRAVRQMSLRKAAAEAGLSVGTWQRIEGSEEVEYRSVVKAVIALGWPAVVADDLVAGLDPERLAEAPAAAGQLIHGLMETQGVSPATLARLSGIAPERLERILAGEGGPVPASTDLARLEVVLGLEPGRLEKHYLATFEGDGEPASPHWPTDISDLVEEIVDLRNRIERLEGITGQGSSHVPSQAVTNAGAVLGDLADIEDHAYAANDGSDPGQPGAGSVRPRVGSAPTEQADA